MTIQFEEVEYCKIKVSFVADPEMVAEKRDEALASLKKQNVKVPGFKQSESAKTKKRKAKKQKTKPVKRRKSNKKFDVKNTPSYERALKEKFSSHLDDVVAQELVAEGYDEALYETKIKPIGYPKINNARLDGNTFSCDMLFLKKPDFGLNQYKGFEIPPPSIPTTADEIAARMLQELREQHGDVVPYGEGDFVQEGDSVTMDVDTTVDGEPQEDLTQKGLFYTLNSMGNNELFDSHLFGMKAGENQKFDIRFDDKENLNPSLKNKTATFNVTLHMGTKKIPHALDDELAKKVGLKTFSDLHEQALGSASAQIQKQTQMLISNQVINRVLDRHEFEVPTWLFLMESQKFAADQGHKWDDLADEEKINLNEMSKKKVRLSLILDSIRDNEPEAIFSDEEIMNHLRNKLMLEGENANEVLSSMQKSGELFGTIASLKDEATVQWLVTQSIVIDEGAKDGKTKENNDTESP